jgi:hypothetical protein
MVLPSETDRAPDPWDSWSHQRKHSELEGQKDDFMQWYL